MYVKLLSDLKGFKLSRDKARTADLIGVIDAVDKKVFAERKKQGDSFKVQDSVVIGIIKNQIKNLSIAHDKAIQTSGPVDAVNQMSDTINFLKSYLPPSVEGDELRIIIQDLGVTNIGQAMGALKKLSVVSGFDYDGAEAAAIAKEIFI